MVTVTKVTNPLKIVTDPVLLSALVKQGIDKDYVEFYQDYASRSLGKGHSPYAKFYRDLKSNRRWMVASGLPMVDTDGYRIEAGWKVAGINYFSEKNNLFHAKVQGTQVEVTIRNDQPDGRKAGDKLTFQPQLFLDGVEQLPSNLVLLDIDPVNPNYNQNVLEWDYGICKRRLRVIEGSLLGSWVFASNPNSEVRIKYNQAGDYRLKLGQFKVNDDEEIIKPQDFDELALFQGDYPVTVADTDTFYPDAHPETSSVDGYTVSSWTNNQTWATIRGHAGASAGDSTTWLALYITNGTNANTYWGMYRSIVLFDTSSLPDDAVISAATLSLLVNSKLDEIGATPSAGITASNPASNTAVIAADYATFSDTRFASDVTYASFSAGSYSDWSFNASGIGAISKTGVSKFMVRFAYDIDNNAFPYLSAAKYTSVMFRSADYGAGSKPKLVVEYTEYIEPTPVPRRMSRGYNMGHTVVGGH